MAGFEQVRSGEERRKPDSFCLLHREEMDQLQRDLNAASESSGKTSGRFTAMLWFLGVIGTILTLGITILISKTSDIQTLLGKNDVLLMQHTERIETLRKDVDEIKTRNRYIDQQLAIKPIPEK